MTPTPWTPTAENINALPGNGLLDHSRSIIAGKKARLAELESKLDDAGLVQKAANWASDGVRVVWNGSDATVWAPRHGEDHIAFCMVDTNPSALDAVLDKWLQERVAEYLGIF